MNTDTPLVEQLRACAASPRTVAWEGSARQLLRWAADTVEAANYALSERRQNAATQGPATSRSQSEVAPARETVADLPAVAAPDDKLGVIAKIDKALQHVFDLAAGRERWTMRIPARPDEDSDIILAEALNDARRALSAPIRNSADK